MNLQLKRKLYEYNINEYNKCNYRRQVCIVSCLLYIAEKEESYKTERRWYVRPLLCERLDHSHFNTMIREQRLSNSGLFFNFARMSPSAFEELVVLVGPSLQRYPSRPDILSVGEILAATLRYLASGESMTDIMYSFRIGKSTVSGVILKCCNEIWDKLKDDMLLKPDVTKWKILANEFETKWQMPHCVAALDGKHVVHEAFANSGSTNFNYKGTHSTILLALCDANYNFISVDIGMPGRCSDGGVFRSSEMGKRILTNSFDLPNAKSIGENSGDIPYFIVADEAFPLLPNLMRPYPGRGTTNLPLKYSIFNYRLSRARRCIENCFGILVARWRIYKKVIAASEETVIGIIKATVVLHNFIKNKETEAGLNSYSSLENIGGEQQAAAGLVDVGQMSSNSYDAYAKAVRTRLTEYLAGENSIPFQY